VITFHPATAAGAVVDAYTGLDRLFGSLDAADFHRGSRCPGWSVADVAFDLLCDARRALVAFSRPTREPADLTYLSYWQVGRRQPADALEHARFVRVSASAYPDAAALRRDWGETAQAVAQVARSGHQQARFHAGAHVLAMPDLLAVLAVRACVHHLDATVQLASAPPPRDSVIELAARTVDGLLGPADRPAWADQTYLLKAAGREPLDRHERAALGDRADRFPLLDC